MNDDIVSVPLPLNHVKATGPIIELAISTTLTDIAKRNMYSHFDFSTFQDKRKVGKNANFLRVRYVIGGRDRL